ncbi:MAG TPA: amidohydrolase family protein [Acidimicrobiales bacterium]|jgi:predicted TIM-barrel fold metal-dependent hydrolase
MPSRDLDFPVFDADNHMYETKEALTKYLPDGYKHVIDYVDVHGRTKIVVRGQISDYIPNPTFERVGKPGAQEEYFKHGNPEGKSYREILGRGIDAPPAFREPAARLELLDEQGIQWATMYPTLASLVEERMKDDPDLTHVVIHALNQWMHEHWTFNYENRIFPVPVITLAVVDKAIAELEWVVERGARAIMIRPAPVPGFKGPRSFGLVEFDPFWQKVLEHDVLVIMHASDSGYNVYANEWEGSSGEMLAFAQPQPFSMVSTHDRAIRDAVTALICHGALTRNPELRVALIENGSSWVRPLLHDLKETYTKMPQAFPEDPIVAFKRNLYVHPFHEEDPVGLVKLLGADRVLFGSDFPHVEGMSDPITYVDELEGLPEGDLRKVMGGNMASLMGVTVDA